MLSLCFRRAPSISLVYSWLGLGSVLLRLVSLQDSRYTCVSPCTCLFRPRSYTTLAALFYTREEIGLRLAIYFGFASVAGAFGGLIAFGIQNAHSAIANWKVLFLIEGFPAIALGVMAIFALPNRPEETHIFNERERRLAIERMNRGTRADVGRVIHKSTSYGFMVYDRILQALANNCRAYHCGFHRLEGAFRAPASRS